MFDWFRSRRPARPAPGVLLRVELALEDRAVPCTGSDCMMLAAASPPAAAAQAGAETAPAAATPVRSTAAAQRAAAPPASTSGGVAGIEPVTTAVSAAPPAAVGPSPEPLSEQAGGAVVNPLGVQLPEATRPDRTDF